MQNVSGETFDAVAVRKSLSELSDFQSVTASPYRVLHQAQGDKQEINPIRLKSSSKTNGSTQRDDAPLPRKMCLFPVYRLEVTIMEYRVRCTPFLRSAPAESVYFLFIALKRLKAF